MRPCIQLPSGSYWYFDDPRDSQYTPEDIAHNLSNLCRFNGSPKYHFSVAQHSVNVSRLVPEELALEALLHDAAEFAYGDMTTHLKALCPDYKAQLARGEQVIADDHNLPREMSPEVKLADLQALKVEKMHLLPHAAEQNGWELLENIPLPDTKHLWLIETPPSEAKRRFLNRYRELTR